MTVKITFSEDCNNKDILHLQSRIIINIHIISKKNFHFVQFMEEVGYIYLQNINNFNNNTGSQYIFVLYYNTPQVQQL